MSNMATAPHTGQNANSTPALTSARCWKAKAPMPSPERHHLDCSSFGIEADCICSMFHLGMNNCRDEQYHSIQQSHTSSCEVNVFPCKCWWSAVLDYRNVPCWPYVFFFKFYHEIHFSACIFKSILGASYLNKGGAGAREQRKLFLVLVQADFFFFFLFVIKASLRLCHSLIGTSQSSPWHVKEHSCNIRRKNIYSQEFFPALFSCSLTGQWETWPEWATKFSICTWGIDLWGFGNQP